MKIETIVAQAAHKVDPTTGAVAPPIYTSTTFERDPDGQFSRGFIYSRNNNPTGKPWKSVCRTWKEALPLLLFPPVQRPRLECSRRCPLAIMS
jgi:cystathionine beta-lyase/cystathionine gamma-synthase